MISEKTKRLLPNVSENSERLLYYVSEKTKGVFIRLYFVILFVSCYTSLYFSSVVILRYTFCLLLYFCEIIELFWHSCGQEGIVLIEEKATNGKIASSRAVMKGRTKYKAASCYKIVRSGFGKGDFFITIPQYASEFLLQQKAEELKEGTVLPRLEYPEP